MNETIVKQIKAARIERGFTQKDLADALNKTPPSISDLERGKVQVSASELYEIAKLLDKPIEYFFGEDFGGKEVEDIIAVTRMQDPERKMSTIEVARMMLKLQKIAREAEKYKNGKDIPVEMIKEFHDVFVPFSDTINKMAEEVNKLRDLFAKEMAKRKIKPIRK